MRAIPENCVPQQHVIGNPDNNTIYFSLSRKRNTGTGSPGLVWGLYCHQRHRSFLVSALPHVMSVYCPQSCLTVQKSCWSSRHHIHIPGRKEKVGRIKGKRPSRQSLSRVSCSLSSFCILLATTICEGGWEIQFLSGHIFSPNVMRFC